MTYLPINQLHNLTKNLNNKSPRHMVKQALDQSHGYYCWRQLIRRHFLAKAFLYTTEQSPVTWLATSISSTATDEWSGKRNHLPTNFLDSSISLAILSTQEIKRHDKEYCTSESLTLLATYCCLVSGKDIDPLTTCSDTGHNGTVNLIEGELL